MTDIEDLLQKTSRTFALTIPCLPQPTRDEVGIAYLLFRIIDTFEDAVLWSPARRKQALQEFVGLLERPAAESAALVETWTREPPLEHAGYQELLARTPYVLEQYQSLRPEAQAILRSHVTRSAEGMAAFVGVRGLEEHERSSFAIGVGGHRLSSPLLVSLRRSIRL